MLVVDASCLFEVLVGTERAESIRRRMAADADQLAPHLIDVEVLAVIRRHEMLNQIDRTMANQAVEDLHDWPGERIGHRGLLPRAWELRATVRTWDAMYVALAEVFDAALLTSDRRLASAHGPTCRIDVVD